jgi:hypothetical protein
MNRSSRRVLAATLIAATTTVGLTASPASADTFTPANTAPTLSSPAFVMPGALTAFQPDAGASAGIYEYDVTVGDAETLNDIATVSVSLYQSLKEDGLTAGEGDASGAVINPANTVKLSWDRPTNAFSISAGASTYWALGTAADVSVSPASLTATTGIVKFKFTVGEAMREGTWTAKATATDLSAATATDATATKAVNAYSVITSRTAQNFGTALASGVGGATKSDAPNVTSNGSTALTLTAGDFTSGSYNFALKSSGATSVAPAAGEVTFDCNPAGTFNEASAVRVGSTATLLGTATSTGTAEGGAAVSDTCRLQHGGQRPVGAYSFTVVNTIANT